MAKVAIMITSCDAYKDCWKPMTYSLDMFWPDCEFPRYLITNSADDPTLQNTIITKIGDDRKSWCTLAKKGLDAIEADYIIYFQDDYWLSKPVNNEAIKAHIAHMEENGIEYLKITRDVLRDEYRIGNTDYCWNPIDIRYSFNTAIAIWKKKAIHPLLIDGWTGWEFERQIVPYMRHNNLSLQSQVLHSSICDTKGITDVSEGAIIRGVWTESAVEFLKENGMEDILSQREIIGPVTRWLYRHSPSNRSVFRYPFWGALKVLKRFNVNW